MSKLKKINELTEEQRKEHLRPEDGCIERNGDSRQFRWCLVAFMNVATHPSYRVKKTCQNKKCSNPHHLYFKHKDDETLTHTPKNPPQKIHFNEVCVKTQSREERLSHIDLSLPCIERGGESFQYRGLLAQHLNTEIVSEREPLTAHACFNSKCSNPKHIYYASHYDNAVIDKIAAGVPFTEPPKLSIRLKIKTKCKKDGESFNVYHLFFWNFPKVGMKKQFSLRTKCPKEAKEMYEMVLNAPDNYREIVKSYHTKKGRVLNNF